MLSDGVGARSGVIEKGGKGIWDMEWVWSPAIVTTVVDKWCGKLEFSKILRKNPPPSNTKNKQTQNRSKD